MQYSWSALQSCVWTRTTTQGIMQVYIIKSFANFRSERLFVFARAHFSWYLKRDDANDNYMSETITTIKTTYVPFGSVIIAIDESENRTRLSLTVSEIFDRKHIALNGERVISLFLLLCRANSFDGIYEVARVKSENCWCWRLQYLRNDNNYRDEGCTVL